MATVDEEFLQEIKKLNFNISELEKTLKKNTDSQHRIGDKLGDIATVISSLAQYLRTKEP